MSRCPRLAHAQIHWPVTEPQKRGGRIDPPISETWAAMERLVDQVSAVLEPRTALPPSSHESQSLLVTALVPASWACL